MFVIHPVKVTAAALSLLMIPTLPLVNNERVLGVKRFNWKFITMCTSQIPFISCFAIKSKIKLDFKT